MSRSPEFPSEAITIRTYADLDAETAAFFGDHYELLILIGRPGLGKTEAMKKYLALNYAKSHLITGKTTPLGAYKECYDNRHRLLIFNDAEVLWDSDNGKTLMRALTEHQPEKVVMWLSSSRQLGNYPTSFKTTSKSAFVMNRFVSSKDPFYEAILDRGHLLHFDPPPAEIHSYVATWFHDQEVFDFVAQHLHHVLGLTARAYNLTAETKAAGLDWKAFFMSRYCDASSKVWLVQKLVNDPAFPTVEDRIKEFIAQGGGCRRTFFNYRAELEKNGQLTIVPPPRLKCKGKAPVKVDRMALIAQVQAAASTTTATPPAATGTNPPPLKVVGLDDDDLPDEPLPPKKDKAKSKGKKIAKKKPESRARTKKPVRGKAQRRRKPHRDAYTASDDTRHLIALCTAAECKV